RDARTPVNAGSFISHKRAGRDLGSSDWRARPEQPSRHHVPKHARHPPARDPRSRPRTGRPWGSLFLVVLLIVPNGLVNLLSVLLIVVPGGVQFGARQRRS